MKPEELSINVMRVENGWVVRGGYRMNTDSFGDTMVARTPEQLTEIIGEWASKQENPQVTVG